MADDDRITALEKKSEAHDRLLSAFAQEVERQGKLIARAMRASEDALRESHHDLQVGVEVEVARLRQDMQRQLASGDWLRKENRYLAFGLAGLAFVCWMLRGVTMDPTVMVASVGGLLGSLAVFWKALDRGEAKAKKDSIAPPRP
jgi:hypothetical protein